MVDTLNVSFPIVESLSKLDHIGLSKPTRGTVHVFSSQKILGMSRGSAGFGKVG